MGLMLETTSSDLLAQGAAHDNAPDKVPAKRLRTIEEAGKQQVPFTTGLLIGIGETLACNLTAEFPAAECPTIDICTAKQCVDVGGQGSCQYNALACNHPNYDRCYPHSACVQPYNNKTKVYRFGCDINSNMFGHHYYDINQWGFYNNSVIQGNPAAIQPSGLFTPGGIENKWYQGAKGIDSGGCVNLAIDCDVSLWSIWSYCFKCDGSASSYRHRHIRAPPSANPAGRACPSELNQTRACDGSGACGSVAFSFFDWQTKSITLANPSDREVDISGWIIRQNCVQSKKDAYEFPSGTVLKPHSLFQLYNMSLVKAKGYNNVICLMELNAEGSFTDGTLVFDAKGSQRTIHD